MRKYMRPGSGTPKPYPKYEGSAQPDTNQSRDLQRQMQRRQQMTVKYGNGNGTDTQGLLRPRGDLTPALAHCPVDVHPLNVGSQDRR